MERKNNEKTRHVELKGYVQPHIKVSKYDFSLKRKQKQKHTHKKKGIQIMEEFHVEKIHRSPMAIFPSVPQCAGAGNFHGPLTEISGLRMTITFECFHVDERQGTRS